MLIFTHIFSNFIVVMMISAVVYQKIGNLYQVLVLYCGWMLVIWYIQMFKPESGNKEGWYFINLKIALKLCLGL